MSSDWPAATPQDLKKFCETEGWACVSHGHGRRGKSRDHVRYELTLADGRMLRTKISHPIDRRSTYGTGLSRAILRDQLCVTEAEFWACVDGSEPPKRDAEKVAPQKAAPQKAAKKTAGRGRRRR